jgi:hypothetical protein
MTRRVLQHGCLNGATKLQGAPLVGARRKDPSLEIDNSAVTLSTETGLAHSRLRRRRSPTGVIPRIRHDVCGVYS